MERITVSKAVKELGLEKESFEKYHRMTFGVASCSKFYSFNKTLKELNGGKFIISPIVSLLVLCIGGAVFAPVIPFLLNYLVGKSMTKLLKEYCTDGSINIEIDDTRADLLYVRNKMLEIADQEVKFA